MDDFFRFEDSGDLEEDWTPSNAGFTSPSHRSLAPSEPIAETSADDDEYSDDFDTNYYDDMFYDDVDTEETQDDEAESDRNQAGPSQPTSPVANEEDPAVLWEEQGPWRPPETETHQEDPGESEAHDPQEDAYSDDFDQETDRATSRHALTSRTVTASEDTAWEDPGPADTTVTDEGPKEMTETTETPAVSATQDPADPAVLWEEQGPWRPPETETHQEDPGDSEAHDPQEDAYSDDFVNDEETDYEASRHLPTSRTVTTEDTAWEDLGPWRAPETETQQEVPGPADTTVTDEGPKETETTETPAVSANQDPADPAVCWEEQGPWRQPEETNLVDPGPADTMVTDEGTKETTETTETPAVSANQDPPDPAVCWEEQGPWRQPEETNLVDPGPQTTTTGPTETEHIGAEQEKSADVEPDGPVEEADVKEEELNLTLEQKRLRFEGRSETIKVSKKVKKKSHPEATQFLENLREMGGGSAGVAWRRLFDNDEVKFDDFCGALVTIHFSGDVIRLWHELAGPSTPNLKFEAVDRDSAAILNAFKAWCTLVKNGPLEVFRAIDQACEGSDSLTAEKFVDGLQNLGFFHPSPTLLKDDIWRKLDTREGVLQNLWPMLDQHCRGCITTDSLLFLEKDPQKRASVLRERTRRRMKRRPPEAHKSEKIIHKLLMETTALGNKHWSQIPEGHVAVGRPRTGVLPKVKHPLPRAVSAPEIGSDLKFLEDQDDLLAAKALAEAANPSPIRDEVEEGSNASGNRPVGPDWPPALLKEERKAPKALLAPSYRRAYCGSLVPLPSLRKVGHEPKMLELGDYPIQKPRKKTVPSKFDPSLLNSFLTSAQDSIWQHYFGASETSQGSDLLMLESGSPAG